MARQRRSRIGAVWSALALASVLTLVLASTVVAGKPVVHQVSAGSSDICEALGLKPGCDANFSLSAKMWADGSVKGEYTDRFARSAGFHAVIDCLVVDGNMAWVSGWITSGQIDGFDLTGLPVSTRLVDNGKSANDPVDQVGLSLVGDDSAPCTDQPDSGLFDLPRGQVTVK